jgi:lipoyl synthase
MTKEHKRRLPPWLKRPLPAGQTFNLTESTLDGLELQTICTHANCPNRGECWARGTATVLILGDVCTRNCKFCSVAAGKPAPPDPSEPNRLADLVERMTLKYLVITSVNRDDLPDKGAAHFRDCILTVRARRPDTQLEILTPDFTGCQREALLILKGALPFVFSHNVETVPSLYEQARQGHVYAESLALLKTAKAVLGPIQTKSSIMLGLGETEQQVIGTLKDLRSVDCDRLTIGQYLRPSKQSLEVVEFVTPQKFKWWQDTAKELGFSWVISEPFARSSYFAEQQ